MRSRTRSSRRCSGPISRASCAKASCAACSRTARSSTCSAASPSISTRSRTKRPRAGTSRVTRGTRIETPEHQKFIKAYQAKFGDYPRLGSVVGYSAVIAAAAAIRKAGSTDPEKIVAALSGLTFTSPFGPRHVPRDRPSIDDGRLRRAHGGEGRQGRDGRLEVRRRQGLPAERRRRAQDAAAARKSASQARRTAPKAARFSCRARPGGRRRTARGESLRVVPAAAPERAVVGVRAFPRRRRPHADLRRDAHRQFRARLAVHAGRVPRVRGGRVPGGAFGRGGASFWVGVDRRRGCGRGSSARSSKCCC